MKGPDTNNHSPNIYSQLQTTVRPFVFICVAALCSTLPFVLLPSLSKASPIACMIVIAIGCVVGWSIGAFVARVSRQRLPLQRAIMRMTRWIIAGVGIFALALSFSELRHWSFLRTGPLLSDSSLWGTAGFLILSFSGILSLHIALFGVIFFTILLLGSALRENNLTGLFTPLCLNILVASTLIMLFVKQQSKNSDPPVVP
jgi:hypothetical protein